MIFPKKMVASFAITVLFGVCAIMLAIYASLLAGCNEIVISDNTGSQMGSTNPGNPRDTTPVVLQTTQDGTAIIDNGKATLDYSNMTEGYICVKSKLNDTKVKVLVDVNGSKYQYTIVNADQYITIPLSCGDGTYQIGVWENVTGDQYAAVFSQSLAVNIADANKPFLYPNQYVDFATGDDATTLSQQYAQGATSDVEALNGIYKYVVENISYDHDKAANVQPGYLPNNTNTINSKQGICFDYAVLTASMLRAQGIPASLVIGYSDTAYHAWIRVYCKDTGRVLASYSFNGNSWERMDPTFDAATKGKQNISGLIGSGTNYQPMFFY